MLLRVCVCVFVCRERDTFGIRHCDLGTSRHMFDWRSVALHGVVPPAGVPDFPVGFA